MADICGSSDSPKFGFYSGKRSLSFKTQGIISTTYNGKGERMHKSSETWSQSYDFSNLCTATYNASVVHSRLERFSKYIEENNLAYFTSTLLKIGPK
jgi:hypothetical protein